MPKTPQQILAELDELIEADHDDHHEEPPEPARRVVVLGPWCHAIFEGPPVSQLLVFTADANGHLELPYFDPTGWTDERLRTRLAIYVTFS